VKTFYNKSLEILPDFGEERTRNFTTVILTLIALSVFGLFAINPTLSTIAKLEKEIVDSEVIKQRLDDKIQALASLQEAYNRLEGDIPLIFEAVPNSPAVTLLTGQIQAVARDSNIRIIQSRSLETDLFKEDAMSQKYYSYNFHITAEGTYEDILRFTENIINIQRVLSINTTHISEKVGEPGVLEFTLEGIAYYKK